MIIKSLTLTGAATQATITADTSKAKWVQLLADSGNSAAINIGGPEVSATAGFPLAAGASQFLPSVSDLFEFYQFNKSYYYAANGDKLHVLYAIEGSNS
jgi:hypothetical protein